MFLARLLATLRRGCAAASVPVRACICRVTYRRRGLESWSGVVSGGRRSRAEKKKDGKGGWLVGEKEGSDCETPGLFFLDSWSCHMGDCFRTRDGE